MITEEWRAELLSKINIADIVGQYVTLVNKGGRLWACCPFHNEKTPSFTVNTDKQFYHCFGCGKSGNAINFIMETEKLTYPEACQLLADKAGMEMPEVGRRTDYEEFKKQRGRVLEMNKIAARYFYDRLKSAEGKDAAAYLEKRGISRKFINMFGMGFATEKWDGLLTVLEGAGYTRSELDAAGLARLKEGKCYDLFRNRVMIPIVNQFSEVIGFGGRVMDGSEPKYLNTPETTAFKKGKNLYNLNLAKKENADTFVLVEGYMDAIALYIYGIKNVVATLGTALTPDQARLIKRYVKKVVVSYDGDSAGVKAAMRAIDILEAQGIEPRVITVPGGMDPDEFLKKHGKAGFLKLEAAAKPVIAYKFNAIAKKYDMNDGYEKEKMAKECADILKTVESPMIREKYVKALSKATGFSESSIYTEIGENRGAEAESFVGTEERRARVSETPLSEQFVALKACGSESDAKRIASVISEEDFTNETYRKIFSLIKGNIKKGFLMTNAEILSELKEEADRNEAAELFCGTDAKLMESEAYFADCVRDMKIRSLERRKAALAKECGEAGEEERERLLKEIKRIIKNLEDIRNIGVR